MLVQIIPINQDINVEDIVPEYGTDESACFDIKANISNREIKVKTDGNITGIRTPSTTLVIFPGQRALVPTGAIFVIPHGYSMRLHPRSGHGWKHGITLMNSEGIIDSDYPNETFVMLVNTTRHEFIIRHGDRICQAEIVPVDHVRFEILPVGVSFPNRTDRTGGLGSTS